MKCIVESCASEEFTIENSYAYTRPVVVDSEGVESTPGSNWNVIQFKCLICGRKNVEETQA